MCHYIYYDGRCDWENYVQNICHYTQKLCFTNRRLSGIIKMVLYNMFTTLINIFVAKLGNFAVIHSLRNSQ